MPVQKISGNLLNTPCIFVCKIEFKYLAHIPVDCLLHPVVYTHFEIICCIRLIWDWFFFLYHHITYICYLLRIIFFLLWYNCPFWRYFMMLLKEIQFIFSCFLFLATSAFFRERFNSFIIWNIRTVVFPHFCLLLIFFLLTHVLSVWFLVAVISLPQSILYCRGVPRCNAYRRRKWTRRNEFKYWIKLIAFHIALIPLGKVWIQLLSL